jgi:serine protease Do
MQKSRFLKTIAVLIVACALIMTSGCELITQTQNDTTTESASQQQTETSSTSPLIETPTTQIQISSGTSQPLISIADVVAKVKPSVVAITVKATITSYDMFGRAYSQEQEGAGSGWIISANGLIVTNNHVVEGATSIMVTFNDGSSLPVDIKTIKYDSISDLAVMQVTATGLPAVTIGNSDQLREGDWVIAIGNSLGEGIRVTQGIVSRQGVSITDDNGQEISGLIETDAVINPGNSGGPLVNMAGEVIGITNAKTIATGVEGVGYAISINTAIPIIQQLINQGYIVRPYLGADTETMNSSYAFWYRLQSVPGALVTSVTSNSPADKAGLRVKDIIVKFNGQNITSSSELSEAIQQVVIGQEVEIVFWRGSNLLTIKLVLTETPKPQ